MDWVIGKPTQAERKALEAMLDQALVAAECVIERGPAEAMNRFNG